MEAIPENIKVPELRFPEFSGDWEKEKLGTHCKVEMCKRIYSTETTPNGEVPFFKIGTIGRIPDAYISRALFTEYKNKYNYPEKGEVMITCSGTVGYSIQFDGEDAYFQDSNIVWLANNESVFANDFLFFLLTKERWHWLGSTTIARIYGDDLRGMRFLIPDFSEQQRIAEFLTAVDEKIAKLKRKKELLEEYKKGMMQKLFSQEIRFKDEDGNDFPDWEIGVLSDVAKKSNEKNKSLQASEVLTNSASEGVVSQASYFDREITTESNLDGYYIVPLGAFVYNPRISKLAPAGPINRNNLHGGLMSPLYTVFSVEGEYSDFLEIYFKTTVWHRYLKAVSNFGVRHDRMNVSTGDFFNMPVALPCTSERQRIVSFVQDIERTCKALDFQLKKAQEFKRGLLQKMFV